MYSLFKVLSSPPSRSCSSFKAIRSPDLYLVTGALRLFIIRPYRNHWIKRVPQGRNRPKMGLAFEFVSNARPSLFAYRASTKPPKKEVVHKVATAVLSTNAQVKARQKKKAANDDAAMDTFLIHADDKKESDGNVEMKIDEGSASPGKDAGDISPINGSISNLAEDEKPSTSAKSIKKVEPSFEMLPNISRITPAQLAHITFPEGRFQPGGNAGPAPLGLVSEKYAGGGASCLILADLQPQEDTEFIDFEPPAAPELTPANNLPTEVLPVGPHIALDETSPAGFEQTDHGRDAPRAPYLQPVFRKCHLPGRGTGQQIERDAPPRSGTMAPLLQHKVRRAETPPEAKLENHLLEEKNANSPDEGKLRGPTSQSCCATFGNYSWGPSPLYIGSVLGAAGTLLRSRSMMLQRECRTPSKPAIQSTSHSTPVPAVPPASGMAAQPCRC
ncbi:hypothetical protein C8J57DRAFT_1477741 [Mycena rebaudengoi]|nr:hypothetical protein C8J57DRAFT_1477741 [Mycena rebaudengoi]